MKTTAGKPGTFIPSSDLVAGMELNDGSIVKVVKRTAKMIKVTTEDGYSFSQRLNLGFLIAVNS